MALTYGLRFSAGDSSSATAGSLQRARACVTRAGQLSETCFNIVTRAGEGTLVLCGEPAVALLLTGAAVSRANETRARTRRWWASVRKGSCGDTANNDPGDCERGSEGSWGLSDAGRVSWEAAVDECAALCGACARCVHVSVSPAEGDCSWYSYGRCQPATMLKVKGFRSGRV